MTNSERRPPEGFDELSVDDQIDLVQFLWDRIAARPERVAEPEWHRELLDDRLAEHRETPEAAVPWEEVRERLTKLFHGPDA